jgi:hypothetical protein
MFAMAGYSSWDCDAVVTKRRINPGKAMQSRPNRNSVNPWFFMDLSVVLQACEKCCKEPRRPLHGGNTGSNPVRDANVTEALIKNLKFFE